MVCIQQPQLNVAVHDVGQVQVQRLDPLRIDTKLELKQPSCDLAAVDRVSRPVFRKTPNFREKIKKFVTCMYRWF